MANSTEFLWKKTYAIIDIISVQGYSKIAYSAWCKGDAIDDFDMFAALGHKELRKKISQW